ncbi:hypothetical protein ACOCEA_03095 [Maribacter sp. CXY002]|uniref:hypothetical protein n=1 Tax=Maribacter luteocoastalis TaxID=3407671 RepID=UPI003B66FE50
MKKSSVKGKILLDLENLITQSCKGPMGSKRFTQLHILLLKKYYNATNVHIDYHRHRIKMDIVIDDTAYQPGKMNINIPIVPTNLLFGNLKNFLKSCIERDHKSLGFYAQILKSFTQKEQEYILV